MRVGAGGLVSELNLLITARDPPIYTKPYVRNPSPKQTYNDLNYNLHKKLIASL